MEFKELFLNFEKETQQDVTNFPDSVTFDALNWAEQRGLTVSLDGFLIYMSSFKKYHQEEPVQSSYFPNIS